MPTWKVNKTLIISVWEGEGIVADGSRRRKFATISGPMEGMYGNTIWGHIDRWLRHMFFFLQ